MFIALIYRFGVCMQTLHVGELYYCTITPLSAEKREPIQEFVKAHGHLFRVIRKEENVAEEQTKTFYDINRLKNRSTLHKFTTLLCCYVITLFMTDGSTMYLRFSIFKILYILTSSLFLIKY